jgi:hypothetical protein
MFRGGQKCNGGDGLQRVRDALAGREASENRFAPGEGAQRSSRSPKLDDEGTRTRKYWLVADLVAASMMGRGADDAAAGSALCLVGRCRRTATSVMAAPSPRQKMASATTPNRPRLVRTLPLPLVTATAC